MNIQDTEITAHIKPYNSSKNLNIKAYVWLVFKGLFVVRGFTIRISELNPDKGLATPAKYWLAKPIGFPSKFRYFDVLDDEVWKAIEKGVIDQFINQEMIPIVETPPY